jgi:hypothetical protein
MIVQSIPYPASAGGSGPSSKWRINVLTTRAVGNVGATEIEMRGTVGGFDQCSGGTALASATNTGSSAANAFDNNSGTIWDSGTTTLPQWIEYDFASNVDVRQFAYTSSGLNGNPTSLNVQYFDTGTSSWVTYWAEDTFEAETRTQLIFAKPDPLIAGSARWRLRVTAVQGGSAFLGITALEFRATAGGADLTVPASADGGNPFGDGGNKQFAFDDTSTVYTPGFHPTAGSPAVIGYRFPSQKVVTEVAINISGSSTNGGPTAFDVQYLDTTTGAWTTSWSVTSSGTWVTNETKVFTKP